MRFLTPLLALSLAAPAIAQTGMNPMGGTGAMGNMKVEDDNDPFVPNTFIGSFVMEMHPYKDGADTKEVPKTIQFWCSADKTLMAMSSEPGKPPSMKIMTDLKDKWTYMLMTDDQGKKSAMKTHKKKVTFTDGQQGQVTMTKETKVIDGHTCTKMIITNTDGQVIAWVAKDIRGNFADLMGALPQRGANADQWSEMKGFPLEVETLDKDGKTTMMMSIKDLKLGAVDASVFSTDGYKVMEIPGMGQ